MNSGGPGGGARWVRPRERRQTESESRRGRPVILLLKRSAVDRHEQIKRMV